MEQSRRENAAPSTYVPVYRGVLPCLAAYSGAAVKAWLWMLLRAPFGEGEVIRFSGPEIEAGTGMSRRMIYETLRELALGHPAEDESGAWVAPPFIEILARPRGRGELYRVRVLKAKLQAPRGPAEAKAEKAQEKAESRRDYAGARLLETLVSWIARKKDAGRR